MRAIYSREQRAAVVAWYDRPGVSAARVSELAAAGELSDADGNPLPAFRVPENTVRALARTAHKARAGERHSRLAAEPARDAIEDLRRRLVSSADAMLTDLEAQPAGKRSPERLRQVARVVREAAALPGPEEPRPPAPGAKVNGKRNGGESKGGIAGEILRAHRASTSTRTPTEPALAPTPEPEPDEAPGARIARTISERLDQPAEPEWEPAPVKRLRDPGQRPDEDTSSWQ